MYAQGHGDRCALKRGDEGETRMGKHATVSSLDLTGAAGVKNVAGTQRASLGSGVASSARRSDCAVAGRSVGKNARRAFAIVDVATWRKKR